MGICALAIIAGSVLTQRDVDSRTTTRVARSILRYSAGTGVWSSLDIQEEPDGTLPHIADRLANGRDRWRRSLGFWNIVEIRPR